MSGEDWKLSVDFLAWGKRHYPYKILCYFVLSGNTPNYKPKYLKKDENGKKNKTREKNNELETEVVSRFFHFVYRNYFFFAGSSITDSALVKCGGYHFCNSGVENSLFT